MFKNLQCEPEHVWLFEGYYSEMENLREIHIQDLPDQYFSSPESFL